MDDGANIAPTYTHVTAQVPFVARANPVLVNFGCGALPHKDWVNLDIEPRDPSILPADFRRPLPFADMSVDAVYHAHLLEHLHRDDAVKFLTENIRVLKPNGILRVVVPDLEALCRHYLFALESARRAEQGGAELYDWSCLDLLDQMVRRSNGGQMVQFLSGIDLSAHPLVAERLTLEMTRNVARALGEPAPDRDTGSRPALARRVRHIVRRLRECAAGLAVGAIAGTETARSFRDGLFRNSGEMHVWMYDGYSLCRLLTSLGLVDVKLNGPRESAIPGYASFDLDEVNGRVRRPGSLFVEGRRPDNQTFALGGS